MLRALVILVFLSVISLDVVAQEGMNKFGVQLKPILPSRLMFSGDEQSLEEGALYTISQNTGYSFGGVVRHDFKDWLSIESGISFLRRNFTATVEQESIGFADTVSLGIIGYEIPIMGLVYVQLAEQTFMDVGFGLSLDMFPSDVGTGNTEEFIFVGSRYNGNMMKLGLKTSVGWEYRTKKDGAIYLGGTFHRPFNPIYSGYLYLQTDGPQRETRIPMSGNYLTFDVRYFFPGEKKEKKKELDIPDEHLPSWMKRRMDK